MFQLRLERGLSVYTTLGPVEIQDGHTMNLHHYYTFCALSMLASISLIQASQEYKYGRRYLAECNALMPTCNQIRGQYDLAFQVYSTKRKMSAIAALINCVHIYYYSIHICEGRSSYNPMVPKLLCTKNLRGEDNLSEGDRL